MGEERYAKYNQERLWTTSSLQNVAKEHGVPKEIALKVFDLKPVAEEQAARIRLDPSLDDDQRRQALKTVEDQTLKAVGDLLGPEVAQTYYREGAWLRNLSRERRTSR
jgi:hypothetical protein